MYIMYRSKPKTINVTQIRENFSEVLDNVKTNLVEVVIIKNKKPIAKITPISEKCTNVDQIIAKTFGYMKNKKFDIPKRVPMKDDKRFKALGIK